MQPSTKPEEETLQPHDARGMQLALAQARRAAEIGEVPVGAVVMCGDELLAAAHNRRELDQDPTAHAEVLAIRQAAAKLGSWRLDAATLYVTLEPCAMCAGALVLCRIARVVYGCDDAKGGALRTLYRLGEDARLNHRFVVEAGVEAEACSQLLSRFFAGIRATARGRRCRG